MNQKAQSGVQGVGTTQSKGESDVAIALSFYDGVGASGCPQDGVHAVQQRLQLDSQQNHIPTASVVLHPINWTFHGKSKRGRLQFMHRDGRYFGVGSLTACDDRGLQLADVPQVKSEPGLCSTSQHLITMFCRSAESNTPYYFSGNLDFLHVKAPAETAPQSANCSESLSATPPLPESVSTLAASFPKTPIARPPAHNKKAQYLAEIDRIATQRAAGLDPDVHMHFMAQYLNESRANIYRKLKLGQFPASVKRGRGAFWSMSVVDAYKTGKTLAVSDD